MTDLKDDELPALPEPQRGASYHFTFVYPISDVKKIQREAIAHGVAMERKHADVIRMHLDTVRFHLTRNDFKGNSRLRHEALDCIEAALEHEAKRRQG